MSKVVLPLAYLPPISWWALAVKYRTVSLEYHETYPRQTYRNRCHIYGANGLLPLVIPVIRVNGNHTKTSEIRIDNSRNWQTVHWRSIEAAYGKSPYFLYYRDFFEPLFLKEHELLSDFNLALIRLVYRLLKLDGITFSYTERFEKEAGIPDFRELIHPKKPTIASGLFSHQRYMQAFEDRHGFLPDLSILDLLFNEGPAASAYLRNVPAL